MAMSGQTGGEESADNLWLAVPAFAASVSALLVGALAAFAVTFRRERGLLVFATLVVGVFVAVFLFGELAIGHD